MMRSIWPLALSMALLLGSCETTSEANTSSSEGARTADSSECRIQAQSRNLDNVLRAALGPNGDLRAVAEQNADRLRGLAQEAAGGASGQSTPKRDAACRAIAVRAYTALLYLPGDESAVMSSLWTEVQAGKNACEAIATPDEGSAAHCAYFDMWLESEDAIEAATALDAIYTANQGATEQSPVPDSTWETANNRAGVVRDAVSHWTLIAGEGAMNDVAKGHRTRVVCRFWRPIQNLNRLEGRDGPAWQRLFGETYPATLRSAIDTIPISAPATCSGTCQQERLDQLSQICRALTRGT